MSKKNQKYLFAFIGKKGSGKDTAAKILSEQISTDNYLVQFAFADILKEIIHQTFNIEKDESEIIKRSNIKPFNGLTLREVYQNFGENIKVFFGEDVWAKLTLKRLQEITEDLNSDFIFCTDLRYPIEDVCLQKFCEDNGINFVKIKMINLNDSDTDNHISETNIEKLTFDYLIEAKSVYEIYDKIEKIIKKEL
jgi:adenylate kinase family enzyme